MRHSEWLGRLAGRWTELTSSLTNVLSSGMSRGPKSGLKAGLRSTTTAGLAFAMALALGLGVAMAFNAPAQARSPQDAKSAQGVISVKALPPEAIRVLVLVQQGGPFPHAKDGTNFFNRERILPSQPRGYYTEYTVPTPGARNRGARRIVAGRGAGGNPATSGEYWYTSDHYSSFQRIQE